MAKLAPYPEYRKQDQSSACYDIPRDWTVKKLKWEIQLKSGTDEKSESGSFKLYGANGIIGKSNTASINDSSGTVLIGRVGSAGEINYVTEPAAVSDNVLIVNNLKHKLPRFDYYLLKSLNLHEITSKNAQPLITASNVRDIYSPYTDNAEERKNILTFLDRETAKIDRLIEKQQRLIELLKEKRQAVISHAVTKGLNPRVTMKDSGVKWLGQVPEHWSCLPAKRIFRLATEPAPPNNVEELLSVYTDIGVRPRKDLEARGNKASTTDGYWRVKRGDLIVNKLLAWMGACGYSDYDGVTSPAYDILRPIKRINTKFYHYLFRSKIAQTEFKRWSRGIMEMRLRLYFDELGRIITPIPPEEEQNRIVNTIEAMEQKFDKLSSKTSEAIILLQERRNALISAAVTGKIDVRDQFPQDVEEAVAS